MTEFLAPCIENCLARGNITVWLNSIKEGKLRKAWEEVVAVNPLPAVCGRVCPHPCEDACQRKILDDAISINALEKFLGDEALRNGWNVPILENSPKTQKIAIIGSGPAGLSGGYQLARSGYKVTIFEALPVIGGMLRVGIPEFRLPKNILEKEIENNILSLGIEVKTNCAVNQVIFDSLRREFDAVLVAIGLQKSRKLNIPGEEISEVLYGLEFLRDINLGKEVRLGKKVRVIGGGNTAIDVARTAKRLGSEVTILYRRTKAEMPAITSEVALAEAEGIKIRELVMPVRIDKNLIEFQRARLGEPDQTGRKKPVPIEGSNFYEAFDNLIIAAGEEADQSFSGQDEKVFSGGDVKTRAGTVAAAIKSGREVASRIDNLLQKKESELQKKEPAVVLLENLDLKYFTPQKRVKSIRSPILAKKEAKRCFGCTLPIERKIAEILIDQERCKGCRLCAEFCPQRLITSADDFNSQGYHPAILKNSEMCRGCALCALVCPDVAIEVEREV